MDKTTAISIIIPVYNVDKYLDDCLSSVFRQTLKNIEVVIINDGSTDNSINIIKKYQNEYNNIILIEQENKGLSVARNVGIEHATGKYITFLDSDDFITENFCEKLYNKAEENKCPLVIGGIELVYPSGKTKPYTSYHCDESKVYNEIDTYQMLLNCKMGAQVVGKLYLREILILSPIRFEPGIYYEDIRFTYPILQVYHKIMFVNQLIYKYRMNANSIVHTSSLKKISDFVCSLNFVISFIQSLDNDKFNSLLKKLVITNLYFAFQLSCNLPASQKKSGLKYIYDNILFQCKKTGILFEKKIPIKIKIKYFIMNIYRYFLK